MKQVDTYKFKKNCKSIEDLCHNTLNRIVEHMSKYHNHSKNLGEYVKLCVVMDKLCNYCSSACCNVSSGISNNLLKECKLKCTLMVNCCTQIKKTKMVKKDIEYIRCDKMIKSCTNLMKLCK